ncbi:hypothetical protein LKM14_00300 [Bacillus cereus]|uniref:hypothetical protein n=1 Tax=Bacillus cereus TaxID=1396 RepID=UPI001E4503DF|nr:hypothetical protein [Bacillus cereus]
MSIQQELALFEEQVEREHAINRRIEVAKMRKQGKRLGVTVTTKEQEEARQKGLERKRAIEKQQAEDIDLRHYSVQMNQAHKNMDIDPVARGIAVALSVHMHTKTESYIVDGNRNRMNTAQVSKAIGKSKPVTVKALQIAVTEGIVIEHTKGNGHDKFYSLNPTYYSIGSLGRVTESFTKVIHTSIRNVLKKLSLEEMGHLSILVNYMHPETHVLFMNPDEQDERFLRILQPKDIAEILDIKPAKARKLINKLITIQVLFELRVGTEKSIATVIGVDPEFFTKSKFKIDFDKIKRAVSQTTLNSKNYNKNFK